MPDNELANSDSQIRVGFCPLLFRNLTACRLHVMHPTSVWSTGGPRELTLSHSRALPPSALPTTFTLSQLRRAISLSPLSPFSEFARQRAN